MGIKESLARRGGRGPKLGKRKAMVVYWDEHRDAELIGQLAKIAIEERRSMSAMVLVALKEYIEARNGRYRRASGGVRMGKRQRDEK